MTRRTYDSQGNRPGTLYDFNGTRASCEGVSMMGYPSQEVEDGLPDYYRNLGIGTTKSGIGLVKSTVFKPLFRGVLQDTLLRPDLDEINLASSDLVLGADKRLYETRRGLIDCLAPVVPKGKPGQVYVNEVDWDSFPPMSQLAYLFDEFFSKYDREVLMIVGKRRDGNGWLFHVPKQTGSAGLVEWSASDGEMAWFSRIARWIGTIHIHPGAWCTPSTTDINDWAEPEKTGLHMIFGRNQDFTINGSIAGRTFELDSGTLNDITREIVQWTTSGRRPLDELLLVPTPIVISSKKWSKFGSRPIGAGFEQSNSTNKPLASHTGETSSFVTWMFNQGGMFKVSPEDLGSMKIVPHEGSYYLVTKAKWLEIQSWANNLVDIPVAKNLSIYPVKGGKA